MPPRKSSSSSGRAPKPRVACTNCGRDYASSYVRVHQRKCLEKDQGDPEPVVDLTKDVQQLGSAADAADCDSLFALDEVNLRAEGLRPELMDCGLASCSIERFVDGAKEIGSGVRVDLGRKSGDVYVLTAGHVAPEVEDEVEIAFANGYIIAARCVAVSDQFDLALLRAAKEEPGILSAPLPATVLRKSPPKRTSLVCVGQPGRPRGSRLEVTYGAVVDTEGDPLCDQLDFGALIHSCPVFAGNSGSALFTTGDKKGLVGIHTSHNHQRHTSHAVTAEAIAQFLALFKRREQRK